MTYAFVYPGSVTAFRLIARMFSRIQLLTVSILLLAASAGAALWKWQEAESRVESLEVQVSELRSELAAKTMRDSVAKSATLDKSATTENAAAAPQPSAPPVVLAATTEKPSASNAEETEQKSEMRAYRNAARLSTIQKFIPLTDEQQKALEDMFDRNVAWREAPGENERDEFAEIVGEENARYYRDQMKQAFEQAETESQEKEVLYLSKRLSLSPEQETQLAAVMKSVSSQLRESARAQIAKGSGDSLDRGERIRRMIAENSMRQQLLNEQLQKLFSAEQYQLYLEQQQDSADSRFQVWHE